MRPDLTATQDPTPTVPTAIAPHGAPPAPPGYELREEVGRGGMGVVYRAHDIALDRDVAIKVLAAQYTPGSGTAVRFLEEARITGRLQHPGIPAVYQVGVVDGRPFLAMKLIRGETLSDRLKYGPPVDRLAVIEAVAQAVGYAHSEGVIHRDLKPANVMVGFFGEIQVMDWGVAKEMRNADFGTRNQDPSNGLTPLPKPLIPHSEIRIPHSDMTRAGSVLGTPAYMAPEQAAADGSKIDRRSDVFGLGAVLCVLLTGQPPYVGEDAFSTHELAARADLAAALGRLDGCGAEPEVVALCKRCLSANPADRPTDGAAVAAEVAALRRAADDRARQAEKDKHAAEVQAGEWRKRRRAALWGGGVLAAVLLTGVATTSIGLIEANVARRAAETAREEAGLRRAEAETAQATEAGLRAVAEASKAKAETKAKETAAVFSYFQERVVAAAKPKGSEGGLGPDVKLKDALFAGLDGISKTLAGQPLIEARLRAELAHSFLRLGEGAETAKQAAEARRLFAQENGPDDPNALAAAGLQADGLFAAGKRAEALALQEEAFARLTATVGPDDRQTLNVTNSLAFSYEMAGRFADADRMWERSVAGHTAVVGPDHPHTLSAVGHLGAGYTRRGKHDDAVRIHRESLAKLTAKLGPDDAAVLAAANNLATGLHAAGKSEEALKLYQETLDRRRTALGADHPSTLLTMHNLASTYAGLKRHQEAAKLSEEVVRLRTAKLGRDHVSTLRSAGGLAQAYTDLGRGAEALPLWQEVVDRLTAAYPADHPDYLPASHKLAELLLNTGRPAEAAARADTALTRAGPKAGAKFTEKLLDVRLRAAEATGDPAGCRAVAERWEKRSPAGTDARLTAACYRAVAARVFTAAGQPAEADADAVRAVAWLKQAVAGGLTDRGQIESEDDLSALRSRSDYKALVAPLAERLPPPRLAAPAPPGVH